jgi:serine protease AprX
VRSLSRFLALALSLVPSLLPARALLPSPRPRAARAPVDSRIFEGKRPGDPASFLVVFRDEADLAGASSISDRTERIRFVADALKARADLSQGPLRARLETSGIPFRAFSLVNMIEVVAPQSVAEEIAGLDGVSAIAPNPAVKLDLPTPSPEPLSAPLAARQAAAVEPNIAKIRAPEVWTRGFRGQNIVIAVADTGFSLAHPALHPHYRGLIGLTGPETDAYAWHDAIHDAAAGNPCGSNTPHPCDDDGHGTGTAGIAVGDDGLGNQIGVAPGAKLIGCRNMDRGVGTPARYTECFEWFLSPTDTAGLNPRPDLAPHVISNSWGCPASEGCTDPNVLRGVVDHVVAAGIAVVVSAGNSGSACATVSDVPTFYASSLTVGATTADDQIASFSSRGPATADGSGRLKPEITAPGVNIRTAANPTGFRSGFTGTSAAAPHVAGAIALLWSARPDLIGRVPETAALLESTAVPLTSTQDCGNFPGSAVPNAVFGYGRLDIAAAVGPPPPPVERAQPVSPPRRRPTPREVPRPVSQ